jgi:cytochrome c oxidase subunit 2
MKMDAVPGIPTTMWFTPKYTTEQMKEITGNKNFVYEIACDQMCGSGHYSMKGIVIVETQEEYDQWLSQQKPQYVTVTESKKDEQVPTADTLQSNLKAAPSKPMAKN